MNGGVVYKLTIGVNVHLFWIAEVQSSSVDGADGANSSVQVQARQSGSLGGDHPVLRIRVIPQPASLFRHCRPTTSTSRVGQIVRPYPLPAVFHMYGASAHWPYGNFSGTDTSGWNGVAGGSHDDGQFDAWVYGLKCKNTDTLYPKGFPASPAKFWYSESSERSRRVGDKVYTARYADGSFAGKILDNRLTRSPVVFKFNCTRTIIDSDFRRSFSKFGLSWNITFGSRPHFGEAVDNISGPWRNNIPVLGEEHWIVSSTTKKLNDTTYTYANGTAELDTGVAFCYLEDKFVEDFYSRIPGCGKKNLGRKGDDQKRLYHLIPVEVNVTPRVELDIGGYLFALENSRLPQAVEHKIDERLYYVGAIQPKTLLTHNSGAAYNGPDLIGRVTLVNMEAVFQMPEKGSHTMSWRRKPTGFTGPARRDW
ncbi:hypothetical protein B0H14DRAFT_2628024 [Mycena olivaceomarginata]|nr:hypothetical protein B0H14DRAFT_2628024 [Mycena olivaceomarginata]